MTTVSDRQAAHHFKVHKLYHVIRVENTKLIICENVLLQSINCSEEGMG